MSFSFYPESDQYGEPIYKKSIESLKHLRSLAIQVLNSKDADISHLNQIKLIGFSQGIAPLNQIIYAIHALEKSSDPSSRSSWP